jgi:hypothetical protein
MTNDFLIPRLRAYASYSFFVSFETLAEICVDRLAMTQYSKVLRICRKSYALSGIVTRCASGAPSGHCFCPQRAVLQRDSAPIVVIVAITEERELHQLRGALSQYPAAVTAILEAASRMRRPVDTLSAQDVEPLTISTSH